MTPAIITTQEWVGEASTLCAAGVTLDKRPRLMFKLTPDRCLPLSYPSVTVHCDATLRGDTIELTAKYRFDSPPPYRKPSDDCDRTSSMLCGVEAPPAGNYVIRLGELAVPMTVGYGNGVGPCSDGESH
jgi:hypothetical protein